MRDFDPYLILDVARMAPAPEIKLAYRRKVQVAHPDRGGDAAAFVLVVKAFGLLSDPDARRLFDETGIVDDEAVKGYRREVAVILADMFDAAVGAAVATGLRLDSVDFVAQMQKAVDSGLVDAKGRARRAEGEIADLTRLRGRIRRNGEAPNIFADRLDTQIRDRAEAHATLRRRVLMLETAIVELGNYASDIELIAALEAAE